MGNLGEAVIDITADPSGMSAGLNAAKGKTQGFLGGMKGIMGGAISTAIGFGIAGLVTTGLSKVGEGLKSIITEAQNAEDQQAQLNAVLKSTNNAVGLSSDQLMQLADSLQMTTRFDDETVLSAENLLLTFTNIGKNVFPEATSTILDMSTALGQDTKASAIQLGKALQDPIMGITALKRVGVNFTDAQKKVIEGLVKTGKLEEAQRLILKELQVEFGGSAEAAGKTYAGQVEILNNKMAQLKENIGLAILPKFTEFLGSLQAPMTSFMDTMTFLVKGDWVSTMANIQDGIGGIGEAFGLSQPEIGQLKTMFADFIGWISPVIQQVGGIIKTYLTDKFAEFGVWFQEHRPLIEQFLAVMWESLKQIVAGLIGAWGFIKPILDALFSILLSIIEFVMNVFTGNWAAAWQNIKDIVFALVNGIALFFVNFFNWIAGFFGTSLLGIITQWQANFNQLITIVKAIFNRIIQIIVGYVSAVYKAGKDFITGLWNGIKDTFQAMIDDIGKWVTKIVSIIKDLLGIASPSTVMYKIGQNMMLGLSMGIEEGMRSPSDSLRSSAGGMIQNTRSQVNTDYNFFAPIYQNEGGSGRMIWLPEV